MPKILKLNKISNLFSEGLSKDYILSDTEAKPDGIVLRSFKMHDYEIADSVLCVARAGAGTNNIPIGPYADKGIVVFNTPGANANAVKELVLCSFFLCGRKIYEGIRWAGTLTTDVAKSIEDGKKAFVGNEVLGKTVLVVGMGAIGILVANAACALGMKVIGYEPFWNEEKAARIDKSVRIEQDLDKAFACADFISLHLPYMDSTKHMINANAIGKMKDGVNIVNCARGELVHNGDIVSAVKSGKVHKYVTDFPVEELLNIENIITVPHLGASSPEAEDNCAVMAAAQMLDFFENGNIKNSVNYPALSMERKGKIRLTVLHKTENIADCLIQAGIKATHFAEAHRGDYGYLIADFDALDQSAVEKLRALNGILRVRTI